MKLADAVVIGGGFSGLYSHYKLRRLGLTVRGFDAAGDVGGTWWWNRYPGARCDIESVDYCYSFSPELEREWIWTERYATQPEILSYLNHVADRFDLRRDIEFGTRVTAATWDEAEQRWLVETDKGDRVSARFCVMAVGCLSEPKPPEIEGIERFAGPTYHTGRWPHEGVDFTGLRVGVIGTGSSGIQSIPLIAQQAAHVTVFQRTPNFAMPAWNAPLDPAFAAERKARAAEIRARMRESYAGVDVAPPEASALAATEEERERAFEEAWGKGTLFALLASYNDILIDREANETVAEYVRARIRDTVHDPELAEKLSPRSYPFGTKRACLATGYYDTFNRDNVSLVDLRDTPITEVVPEGVRTTGALHELDALVFATGFDAMTGALYSIDITGVGGVTLRERWVDGPRTYLGIASVGFPNLFIPAGPQSPSVLTNMAVSIEQHVDWMTDAIAYLSDHDLATIEPTAEAEQGWIDHCNEVADLTLFPLANSWYIGANVPGKPRVFLPYAGGVQTFALLCDAVAASGYEGFTLAPAKHETVASL